MVDSVTNKYECLVVSHKKRLLSFAFVELTILVYLSFRKNYNNPEIAIYKKRKREVCDDFKIFSTR